MGSKPMNLAVNIKEGLIIFRREMIGGLAVFAFKTAFSLAFNDKTSISVPPKNLDFHMIIPCIGIGNNKCGS